MTVKTLMAAEELLRRPHNDLGYELIEGELIEMSAAMPEHGWHAAEKLLSIGGHANPRRLGVVFDSSVGFKFGSDPDTVLEPDASFFRTERLPPRKDWQTFFTVPPDIAVEILSPSEQWALIAKKIGIYLAAGVRLLWLLGPRKRTVTVHAPGREPISCGTATCSMARKCYRISACRWATFSAPSLAIVARTVPGMMPERPEHERSEERGDHRDESARRRRLLS